VDDIWATAHASSVAHRFCDLVEKMRWDDRISVEEGQNIATRRFGSGIANT